MSKRAVVLSVALAALVLVPSAAAKNLTGVVVKVDSAASLLAVARENGDVEVVRTAAAAKAHLGQRVRIDARRVEGNVFVPERIRLLGDAREARLKGTVHAASASSITLAAGGVLLSIDLGRRGTLRVGARVDLRVTFARGGLVLARVNEVEAEEEDEDDDGVVERDHEHEDCGADDSGNRGRGGGDDGGGSGRG